MTRKEFLDKWHKQEPFYADKSGYEAYTNPDGTESSVADDLDALIEREREEEREFFMDMHLPVEEDLQEPLCERCDYPLIDGKHGPGWCES